MKILLDNGHGFDTPGKRSPDGLATCLYEAAKNHLPGHRLRTDYTDGDPDIEKDLYIIHHTSCPAVLTENLFMDNREDVPSLSPKKAPGPSSISTSMAYLIVFVSV